jgi:hypothetical protein
MEKLFIGGSERPIEYGWNGIRIFCRLAGITLADLTKLGDDLTPDNITMLIYAGLKHATEREKQPVDFSVDDVGDWINDDITVISRVMQIFKQQMPQIKNQQAPAEGAK